MPARPRHDRRAASRTVRRLRLRAPRPSGPAHDGDGGARPGPQKERSMNERRPGPLALVGGREWVDGCTFDAELLAASGASEVLVLPTAAAYEHPQRAVARATAWFAAQGVGVRGLMVMA